MLRCWFTSLLNSFYSSFHLSASTSKSHTRSPQQVRQQHHQPPPHPGKSLLQWHQLIQLQWSTLMWGTSYNMEQRLNTLLYKTLFIIIRIEYCTTLEKGLNNYLYYLDSFRALTSTCIAHLHYPPLAVRTLLPIWSDASYPHIIGLA